MQDTTMLGSPVGRTEGLLGRVQCLAGGVSIRDACPGARRTNLYPHRVSIFIRLACQMCVSSQTLSPSLNIVCISRMGELYGKETHFDALITSPYEGEPFLSWLSSI